MTESPNYTPLSESYFCRPTVDVARDLVGKLLVKESDNHEPLIGRIVETEAYREDEPACHAWSKVKRRTGRVPAGWRGGDLLSPPGLAYVYLNYGMYWLLNVVTEEEGVGAAVLIRAVQPIVGLHEMRRRRPGRSDTELTSGPGRLTVAFGIDQRFHLKPLTEPPLYLAAEHPGAALEVGTSVRIGITKAADLPWRFFAVGNPWVSKNLKS